MTGKRADMSSLSLGERAGEGPFSRRWGETDAYGQTHATQQSGIERLGRIENGNREAGTG